jgi:acetyl esterase/lipase
MSNRDILVAPAPPADERVVYGDEPQQFGDLRLPHLSKGQRPYPVVLAIHGGFWRAGFDLIYMGHLCEGLRAAGVATWNVEYRRVGEPGGGWPGTFEDVARAADYLRPLAPRYDLDLTRVVTLGHSAGGHLALWLAARPRIPADGLLYTPAPLPVQASVSLAGVVDLREAYRRDLGDGAVRELMGGAPDDYPARYATASPAALLPLGVPQGLVHGTDDDRVPYAFSRDYQALATTHGDDARLITLPDADHFSLVTPDTRESAIVLETTLALL